jgi:hypothetical protein
VTAGAQALQAKAPQRSGFAEWWEEECFPAMRAARANAIARGELPSIARYWTHPRPCVVVNGATAPINREFDALTATQKHLQRVLRAVSIEQGYKPRGHEVRATIGLGALAKLAGMTKSRVQRNLAEMREKHVVLIWDVHTNQAKGARPKVVTGEENRRETTYLIPDYEDIKRRWFDDPALAKTMKPGGMLSQMPWCIWTRGAGMQFVRAEDAARFCLPAEAEATVQPVPEARPRGTVEPPPRQVESAPPAPPEDPREEKAQAFKAVLIAKYIGHDDPALPDVLNVIRTTAAAMNEELADAEILELFDGVWKNGGRKFQIAPYYRKGVLNGLAYFFKQRRFLREQKARREEKARKESLEKVREAMKEALRGDSTWLDDLRRMMPDVVAEVEQERARGKGGGASG